MRARWIIVLCVAGCGSSSAPPAEEPDLSIVEEDDDDAAPDETTPPELLAPSPDPATTCLRVADRLAHCHTTRAARVVDDLEPGERAQVEAALADTLAALAKMREQCRAPLEGEEATYVQSIGRCLTLSCPALQECVSR